VTSYSQMIMTVGFDWLLTCKRFAYLTRT